jgi:hypothetical protein
MPARKKRPQIQASRRWIIALGVLALAAPLCFPLLTPQLPGGHDTFFYHPRLVEFHENIINGILIPRWAPDLGAGAGQPLFIFTPPLPYYLAEFWHLLGFDIVVAFNLTAITAIVASAWFIFLFADYQFGRKGGWLATAAYLYAPYFHVDVFVRHAFAELMAFPFYPLTLYGFSRYSRENNIRFLIVGALAWAAIILSHNPSALLFSPLLLIFVSFLGWKSGSVRSLAGMLGGIAIGTASAAFVWLPALAERNFVYIERSLQATTNYLDHFVYPSQLWSTTWGFGLSIAGGADQLSLSFGWEHLLVIPVTVWLVISAKKQVLRAWSLVLGSTFIIIAVMMTPLSLRIWELLPLLKQVQFPWRLFADGILIISAMAAVYGASIENRPRADAWFWVGLGLLVVPNLSHVGFEKYYPLVPSQWTPDAIAMSGIETTANGEFEPRWVKQRTAYTENKVSVVSGTATVSKIERTPTFWQMDISGQTETIIQPELLYFPGWTVSIDGKPVTSDIGESGRIRVTVPAGLHHVAVQFRRTTIRFVSELIGSVTVLAALFLLCRKSFGAVQQR